MPHLKSSSEHNFIHKNQDKKLVVAIKTRNNMQHYILKYSEASCLTMRGVWKKIFFTTQTIFIPSEQ